MESIKVRLSSHCLLGITGPHSMMKICKQKITVLSLSKPAEFYVDVNLRTSHFLDDITELQQYRIEGRGGTPFVL